MGKVARTAGGEILRGIIDAYDFREPHHYSAAFRVILHSFVRLTLHPKSLIYGTGCRAAELMEPLRGGSLRDSAGAAHAHHALVRGNLLRFVGSFLLEQKDVDLTMELLHRKLTRKPVEQAAGRLMSAKE